MISVSRRFNSSGFSVYIKTGQMKLIDVVPSQLSSYGSDEACHSRFSCVMRLLMIHL